MLRSTNKTTSATFGESGHQLWARLQKI